MGGESLSLYTPYRTLFYHQPPSREDPIRSVPHDLRDSALSTSLDLASTGLDAQRRSAGRKGPRGTGLRVFSPSHPRCHHGVQGWPPIPRARRYNHLHKDRQNFTSRHPRRPGLLLPYKRAGKGSTRGQEASQKPSASKQRHPTQRSTSQAITLVLFFLP
jgi:hypothetical protein